ncbi:hypothetical protein PSCICO_11720 [Pseudomonas cichorii]|uniref:hypothetical protein n=1 Tax=Pseudomonas cichorii TaxID=36746 RepID=UPI0019108E03|nr:hypothetical protein [Pseudomonas cichorii]GFM85773.1 hypothetical protein PSCICO_11720 [Pseudomonas cichorii]
MADLMDFEAVLRQDGKPLHLAVFFTGPDFLSGGQVAHALQTQLPRHVMPDALLFLLPKYTIEDFKWHKADRASPLMAQFERKGSGSPQTYGVGFYDEAGSITDYVHISGPENKLGTLVKSQSSAIVKAGLAHLVKSSDVLKKAPAGFFYSKPSSRASNYFIRAEDLLSETLHAHYLAFACLPLIKKVKANGMSPPDTLYLDTIALLPLAFALQMYLMRFDQPLFADIRSFHSHEGLVKDGPLPKGASAMCLISASTRCGLAEQWAKINSAAPCLVTTILSFESEADCCTILHTLKQPDDFEMLQEGDSGGTRLIRIHGERFVAEHSETRLLNITTDHAPTILQPKFYSFMGANLFSCFRQDKPGARSRTVHVDKDSLVATDGFKSWFETVLLEEAVSSTRWIIHDDDEASASLADGAIAYLKGCGVEIETKVSFDKFDAGTKFDGSVIVLAAAVERGSRLQSVSRRLRTAQRTGTRLYIAGALFGRSYQTMKELHSNLTQPAKDHSRYVFKTYMEIPAAELTCADHWDKEQTLLSSLHSFSTTFSPPVTARMEVFDQAPLQGLALNPFWPSSHTHQPMALTRGFAFVDGKPDGKTDVTVATSTDIFLTILWILQNARYSEKVANAKRLESGELQQVLLSPEVFSRFDDGIIQASFLHAALPTELDYRADEAQSLAMSDIIYRLAAGYGHERGEAAMEFVIALAIEKIRLHKKEDTRLRRRLIETLESEIPEIEYLLDPEAGAPL